MIKFTSVEKSFKISLCILFFSFPIFSSPGYEIQDIGKGIATSINDAGEVAGYSDGKPFFWCENEGFISVDETVKSMPKLTDDGRVFMTIHQPKGWLTPESIHPICWRPGMSVETVKIPKMESAYLNAVSSSGHLVIGDTLDPAKSTVQYYNIGAEWEKSEIDIHAINDHGVVVGAYRHLQDGVQYQLPAIMDLTSGGWYTFQFVGSIFSVSNHGDAVGVYLDKGKKRGLSYTLNEENYRTFNDFWLYKVNDSGLALGHSTSDISKALFLIDITNKIYYNAYALDKESSIEVLHLYDINTSGDLCGVGLKDGEQVAIKLRAL